MTSVISRLIIKTLCEHKGCMDFQSLQETMGSHTGAVLESVLLDNSKVAIKTGKLKAAAGQKISPDSLVVAKTSLKICHKKPRECQQCDSLHLCRNYICGNCTFGYKCKHPHSLECAYNATLLQRHDLQDLSEKEISRLLLQNDPNLLPKICGHYNMGNGLHGSCNYGANCTKLHICQYHFQGDCRFGTTCKRAHNIDEQGLKMFRRFSEENIRNLHEIYRNTSIIMGLQAPSVPAEEQNSRSKPLSDIDRNEICFFFLLHKRCRFNEKCVRVHWHLPYKWQVLDSDGATWKDLPNMEEIEKAYSDPGNDTSSTSPTAPAVNFTTMTYGTHEVRRLSTASSVLRPPTFILTTRWIWYWRDDTGKWHEYGEGDDGDSQVSSACETLENAYLTDRDGEIAFDAGNYLYILHFKGEPGTPPMYQENLHNKTRREVRRRPRFMSADDVKMKLESISSGSTSSSTADSVPPHWDKTALPEYGYRLVPLSDTLEDYKSMETLFKQTVPQSVINSIQRVQNPALWDLFQWQKKHMKMSNGGNDVKQLYLFHGTDESLVEAICEQNFDWRMCGVHGTSYGKGSYFARDASYSDRYASIKRTTNKIMFVSRVLVGEYCKGQSNYVRPPPKGDSKILYDSCVNDESNPSIYVIFEKLQIYPEYVINYS